MKPTPNDGIYIYMCIYNIYMFVFDEKSTWKWPRPPMEMNSLKALIGHGNRTAGGVGCRT
jgi:hypothetical protein